MLDLCQFCWQLLLLVEFILNVIPNSRSEPYLLNIGLINLILYLVLILIKFLFIDKIPRNDKSKVLVQKLPIMQNILLCFFY